MDESVFKEIVKYSTDAVVVTDTPEHGASKETTITFVNRTYEKMTGYSKEEVIGKTPKILQGPETDEKELDKLRDALKSNQPGHAELINYKKNGEKFWSSVSIFPIKNDSSDVIYWVGIKRDISEMKKAQLKLAETEQNFRNIVENSTIMYYSHDVDGFLKYVSPQSKKILGSDPEKIKGEWTDFITDHPVNEKAKGYTLRAITTGQAQPSYELQLRKTDGTLIWVEVNEAPIVKNGKTVEIIGSLTDITDRKKAEQNQRLLEGLTDQSWAIIWLLDSDGKYVFVNHKYKSIFGFENQQVIGKTVFDLFDEETARKFHKNNVKTLNSNKPTIFEERIPTVDGERYYKTNSFPLKDLPGLGPMAGGFAIDITKQKQDQQLIKNSLQEKEILLLEIHHRVKNNLAIISGLLELELHHSKGKTTKEFVNSSQLRIQSMVKIHELLYQSESFSNISFKEYVKELISTIQTTIQSERFNPQFKLNIDDIALNINQAIPCGLILNELISNSVKFAFPDREKGTIFVALTHQNDKIHLSVEDDGIGVSEDFNIQESQTLGMTLIKILSKQLIADLSIGNSDNGFKCTLTFEKKEVKGSASNIV